MRASFLECGADPRAVDTMSLYEVTSMIAELAKRQKKGKGGMNAAKFDELKDKVSALPWVKVN